MSHLGDNTVGYDPFDVQTRWDLFARRDEREAAGSGRLRRPAVTTGEAPRASRSERLRPVVAEQPSLN